MALSGVSRWRQRLSPMGSVEQTDSHLGGQPSFMMVLLSPLTDAFYDKVVILLGSETWLSLLSRQTWRSRGIHVCLCLNCL